MNRLSGLRPRPAVPDRPHAITGRPSAGPRLTRRTGRNGSTPIAPGGFRGAPPGPIADSTTRTSGSPTARRLLVILSTMQQGLRTAAVRGRRHTARNVVLATVRPRTHTGCSCSAGTQRLGWLAAVAASVLGGESAVMSETPPACDSRCRRQLVVGGDQVVVRPRHSHLAKI